MTNSNFTKKGIALSVGVTTAALVAVAPAAEAASFNLNFDEGVNGSSVLYNSDGSLQLDQWEDWGVTLSGYNQRKQREAKLNTYDSNSRGGADDDLETGAIYGTALQGNVLIIQEEYNSNKSGGQWIADDEWGGGNINFGFDSAVSLTSFSMLDIDDNGSGIKVTGKGTDGNDLNIDIDALINDHEAMHGNKQGSVFSSEGVTITQLSNKRNNNSMYQFDLDQSFFANRRFTDVEFTYPGSGAISGIQWQTNDAEDIPEPSVVGGLLMLGFIGASKYRKNKLSA